MPSTLRGGYDIRAATRGALLIPGSITTARWEPHPSLSHDRSGSGPTYATFQESLSDSRY